MQPDDLADPQPQAGHTQNHRSVTQPALRRRIQRADQLLERSRIQIPDETAPPVRHHRDRGLQPVPAQTFGPQEPEERPQRGCHQLQSPRVVSPCRHPDETDHVTDADPLHLDLAIGKHPLQEPTGEPGVIPPGPRANAPRPAKMLIEIGKRLLDRPPNTNRHDWLLVFRTRCPDHQEALRLCSATRRPPTVHGQSPPTDHLDQSAQLHIIGN